MEDRKPNKTSILLQVFNVINLALRNIRRNKSRSMILSTGLILSITILSGTFSYVDTSSAQLISRSMDNLPVDMSMNFLNRSATVDNVTEVLEALQELPESKIFESMDPIIGGFPFEINFRYGFAISNDTKYELNRYVPGAEGSYVPSFAFGLTAEYLQRRNTPFTTTTDTDINDIGMNEILISKTLAERMNWGLGETVNISYAYGITDTQLHILMGGSLNLTIAGFVDVNIASLLGNLKAYIPEIGDAFDDDLLSLISFQSISADMFFINWKNMIQMTDFFPYIRFIHGIHLSLDTEELGSEVELVEAQLINVESILAINFPELIVTNFAYDELQTIADRLLGFRLFILYFSMGAILLGFIFTLYANDLTLSQRKKEISMFRLRNTHRMIIQYIAGTEVFILSILGSFLGFILGTVLGYILSILPELSIQALLEVNLSYEAMRENISTDSLITSVFIGISLSSVLTIIFINRISKFRLSEEIRRSSISDSPIWRKYFIDIIILIIISLIYFLTYTGFNPIPSFAQSLYDLIVPIFTWIGLTLFSLRLITGLLNRIERPLGKVLKIRYGTPGIAYAKALIRNRYKLISPILILLLSLSMTLTVANITTTFNHQADLEARYAVGSDIRIQFPALDQMEYKTSDFKEALEEIPGVRATEIFITLFDVGVPALAVLMDPIEFLEISYFRDDFFYYNTPQHGLTELGTNPGGLGMIFSFNLGFPFADDFEDITKGPATFDENESLPLTVNNENYEIPIIDIAIRIPGLSDLVGRPSEELPFVLMNYKFFTEPLPRQEEAIAPALKNATHLFIDVDESIISIDEVLEEIDRVYNSFGATYNLNIRTVDDYMEEFFELGDLLLGLTQLEFITISFLLIMTLYLYVLSEFEKRKVEYAILQGIGWSSARIQAFMSTQISFISAYSILAALLLMPLVTQTYIPLLSTLFLFPIDFVSYSTSAVYLGIGLLLFSSISTILFGSIRNRLSNVAEVLRGV
ncbi:MAG: hypothetical protein INQ03_13510 [Candidatus Heimdallarchaeota archaeon]|nr:hypothetical protein [Candidatus Heimdallarchaeota archaeon]